MSFSREDLGQGVWALTFHRPPANAITKVQVDELGEHLAEMADDDAVRALVFRSGAKLFSAGLDLEAMADGGLETIKDLGDGDGLYALWTFPKPTVAQIAGHAIAGGAVLALACDERVAADGSYGIGVVETAVGVPFPRGAFEISRHALGAGAWEALLAAEVHPPAKARELGFVHEVVAPEDLEAAVMKRAARRASYGAVYAQHKALLLAPALASLRSETEEEKARRHAALLSETTRAAVARAARR